ncbi:MAG: radical SAM protein [Synergistaceae bacterium]|nr:radical SAM protein [Synergistaceae bacterium]
MQTSIKKFVECTVPISHCNLRCSYCYIIQENRRDADMPGFRYSPEYIGRAFRQERWGGTMLVNLCGAGETLLCPQITEVISAILEQGHFMNVTTNGTISAKFDEIARLPEELRSRLCFAFSLHYTELKRTHNLQNFAENVRRMQQAGCSVLVQLNLCDEYIDCKDEIKQFCIKNFGALPHVALTRNEHGGGVVHSLSSQDTLTRNISAMAESSSLRCSSSHVRTSGSSGMNFVTQEIGASHSTLLQEN